MEQNIQNQPLISIITVCFNSAVTIRRTIESVLNQTYMNIEYILVDGKSTDTTVAIIEEYVPLFAERGMPYKWVSESDKGIYDAMNKGILMATGEWINIQGSDDWLNHEALEIFVKELEHNNSADIYWFGANIIMNDFQLVNYPDINNLSKYKLVGCHQAAFVTRSLMHYGFSLNYKLASDFEFILRNYICGAKIITKNSVIVNYSFGGASNINQITTIREYWKIANCWLKHKLLVNFVHFNLLIFRVIITQNLKKIISKKWYIRLKNGKC